jgi:hypothetical protein
VAEDLARGEPEKNGVPDGPGRAGDGNMNWTFANKFLMSFMFNA